VVQQTCGRQTPAFGIAPLGYSGTGAVDIAYGDAVFALAFATRRGSRRGISCATRPIAGHPCSR